MLVQLICSGEKLLPCPAIGCQNKTTRSPSLLLPHHLCRHQFITLCPQLPPSSGPQRRSHSPHVQDKSANDSRRGAPSYMPSPHSPRPSPPHSRLPSQ